MAFLLASASPQRRALLEQLAIPLRVFVPDVEELAMGAPNTVALTNAARKADAALAQVTDIGDELVLACDTVVDVDGVPFGKPESHEDAYTMLALLRGRTHDVVGGFVVHDPTSGLRVERAVRTKVRFRNVTEALLTRYVEGEEWRGRAGGYAIQGTGAALVSGIGGCYPNVVGLPIATLLGVLEETADWDARARASVHPEAAVDSAHV
jgi:septum formation protein